MADWFRKSSWTVADEEDFWAHLNRARPNGRAQYLRIQAFYLASTGDPKMRKVATELLDRLISDFPDSIELSSAYAQRASISASEGDSKRAIDDYRAAIVREAKYPNMRSYAWLEFSWLVATNGLSAHYNEVLGVLKDREADAMFPVDHFRLNAVRGIIAKDRGQEVEARNFASESLRQSKRVESGFTRHPLVGLVTSEYAAAIERLQIIENG
jgi:hypothetical protein